LTRILLIDDHSLFREAIARLLGRETDFEIVGECATVDEGITVLRSSAVDVVLLDINLGLQQGGAFLPLARDAGFKGKILVVTAGVSKLEAGRLAERGCAGIILKQEHPDVLIHRIREVASQTGAEAGPLPLPERPAIPESDALPSFTSRERQVLRAVFAGQSNKEIAFTLAVSEPLVKSVLQQLFSKTGVRTRSQLVRVALERYWKELEGPED
jgi:two-component system, NarL family, nitrate/nitrite response regulator NarL